MNPRARLLRLTAWAAAANLGLVAAAAVLASNAHTAAAAHRLLVICGFAP